MNVKNQHLVIFWRGIAALVLLFAFSFTANANTDRPHAGMECFSILDEAPMATHHNTKDTHKDCAGSAGCSMASCSGIFLNQPSAPPQMVSFHPLSRILAPDDNVWRAHPPSVLFRPPIL
ncbi:MAG: hypothetical protein HOI33_07275 [Rhodospirillaceae bacterium]|jgi:hypothetical protein|nr:hypothetical protein [Rhodospirillaceae bacterium]